MKTFRPFGVTLRPNPGQFLSQWTASLSGVGSASIVRLVSLTPGVTRHSLCGLRCYLE